MQQHKGIMRRESVRRNYPSIKLDAVLFTRSIRMKTKVRQAGEYCLLATQLSRSHRMHIPGDRYT